MMARRMDKKLGLKSLQTSGLILGLVFSVILSAQGKQCYECNNDDKDCFPFERIAPGAWSSHDIPTHYIKDCDPRAIGCILFEAFYEFVLGDFFHRSCLYETDKICFYKDGDIGKPKPSGLTSYYRNHTELLSCLKKSRSDEGLPEFRMPKRQIPKVKALSFHLEYGLEDLTNNKKIPTRGVNKVDKEKDEIPKTTDSNCYSCENEMSEYGFEDWRKDHLNNPPVVPLPYCSEGKTKSIQCKGAYGCASFWEVREEANRIVSRVWRDCWYPGEMKCLRNPDGVITALRTLKDSDDEESCKAKFFHRNACLGCSNTVWQGILNIESLRDYGAYLECVKDIREKEGKEFNWSIKEAKDFKNPPGSGPFARIRFYYCASDQSNCNKGKEAPKEPTTTTKATTSKGATSKAPAPVTTRVPSVIVKPPGGGGSGGGSGVEVWQGCKDEGGTGIGILLHSDAYLVLGLIFCSVSIL